MKQLVIGKLIEPFRKCVRHKWGHFQGEHQECCHKVATPDLNL